MSRCCRASGSAPHLRRDPLAFIVTALIGLLIERVVVRRLYGRLLDTLLATWGIAILIQQRCGLSSACRSLDPHPGTGPGLQNVSVPAYLQGTFAIGGAEINRYRTFIILVTAILALITWFIIYRTTMGTQVRAIIRNPKMAAACGIDVTRVNALTFAFGSGLAGVAGVMMSGSRQCFPTWEPRWWSTAFLVVVMGGVGSLLGSVFFRSTISAAQGTASAGRCRDHDADTPRAPECRCDRDRPASPDLALRNGRRRTPSEQAADAAHHDDKEAVDHIEVPMSGNTVLTRTSSRRHAREPRTKSKSQRVDPRHVDAAGRCHLGIADDGAHLRAHRGAVDDEPG